MISRIKQYPRGFQIFSGSIRRAVFRKFPYSIYFLVMTELAVIFAVLHQRQSDILWTSNENSEQMIE